MKVATAFALISITLLGIGTTLNADMIWTPFLVVTGFGIFSAPVIVILVLFAAGSWFLFLLIASVSQGILLRRIERLSAALAERDCEVLRLKATVFDESAETMQSVAQRLDRRLRDLEPLLAGRRGEPAAHAGSLGTRTASPSWG